MAVGSYEHNARQESVPIIVIFPTVAEVQIDRAGTPTESDQYTLTCTVSGHHQALMTTVTYQWFNNSSPLPNQMNSTYTFTPDRYDNGTYTCKVNIISPLLNSDIIAMDSTVIHVTG